MPGIPQLREAARLYSPDGRLLAMVRLEQRMDGSGIWVVLVNDPAKAPTEHGEFTTEAAA
ncbi:hypothetical protein ACQEVC_45435 [Plantactinospora sp. CA-294935]|uniref:hypothetical protein n=1 Tax=Plantactinospora sp. CA-294935 TaxID=3240012 RepID=UPI003D8F0624